jgi:predicted transposase/invertase (TIGR01784 family)
VGLNTKHKDSVFSFLFSKPEVLRTLYSALEGVELSPDVNITINTLSDVIFKDQINDLSFMVADTVLLISEHQSSINPNMPLRLFKYAARLYEKISGSRKIYGKELLQIPYPQFIVLYNGTDPYPDKSILKLSDAFKNPHALLDTDNKQPDLELLVKVYNINPGHNEEILKKCDELMGYSIFVEKVRQYKKEIPDKELAFRKAIEDCIEHNILRDFLKENATEVLSMLLTEWNTEDALVVEREEGRGEGRQEKAYEAARRALQEGITPELVNRITGLDIETVNEIAENLDQYECC